jgi:hypothetical protein
MKFSTIALCVAMVVMIACAEAKGWFGDRDMRQDRDRRGKFGRYYGGGSLYYYGGRQQQHRPQQPYYGEAPKPSGHAPQVFPCTFCIFIYFNFFKGEALKLNTPMLAYHILY